MTGGRDRTSILADRLLFASVRPRPGYLPATSSRPFRRRVIGKPASGRGLDWKTSCRNCPANANWVRRSIRSPPPDPTTTRSSPPLPSSGARICPRVGRSKKEAEQKAAAWPGTCSTTVPAQVPKTSGPRRRNRANSEPGGGVRGPRVPELPEVETIRPGLAAHIVGRRIEHVEVFTAGGPPSGRGAKSIIARLRGLTITDVRRRGKYLWLNVGSGEKLTDDGWAVVIHLGMSGQLLIAEARRTRREGPPADPREPGANRRCFHAGRIVVRRPATFGGWFIDDWAIDAAGAGPRDDHPHRPRPVRAPRTTRRR